MTNHRGRDRRGAGPEAGPYVPHPSGRIPATLPPMPAMQHPCGRRRPTAAHHLAVPRTAAPLRLWVLSDLRTDLDPTFALPDPLPDFDAMLVAGGVRPGLDASLLWLADALGTRRGARPVIFVPGNVEYWSDVPLVEALARGRRLAAELGIHLLSDDAVRIGPRDGAGLHVVGATLWTDWSIDGRHGGRLARVRARKAWQDAGRIVLRRDRPWSPLDALGAHARSRAYVEDVLAAIAHQAPGCPPPSNSLVRDVRPGDRAVVLTYHGPSRRSLPDDWPGWLLDDWVPASLVSDLEETMHGWGAPALWVHGAVPRAVCYRAGRTRVVTNPGQAGPGFDPRMVVEA